MGHHLGALLRWELGWSVRPSVTHFRLWSRLAMAGSGVGRSGFVRTLQKKTSFGYDSCEQWETETKLELGIFFIFLFFYFF